MRTKHLSIEYRVGGLNSNRSILNAVIDLVDGAEERGIVFISPEVNLDDVKSLIQDGLVYDFDLEIMDSMSKSGVKQFISGFINLCDLE